MAIQLKSKPFGLISISDKQVITFPQGILGFETYRKFALIEESEESPFKWLQSMEEEDLAFIIMQPQLFYTEYSPAIPASELVDIALKDSNSAIQFVIVTIPNNKPEDMTANLQGPILINKSNLIGKQVISSSESHPVRARIADYIAKMEQNC